MLPQVLSAVWPKANASPEELMQWRTIVGVVLLALISNAVVVHTTFARAADVKQVAKGQLDGEIWAARKEQCLAPQGSPYRESMAKRVLALLEEYKAVVGEDYPLPACSEFGGV